MTIPKHPLSIDPLSIDSAVTAFWCEACAEALGALLNREDDPTLEESDVSRINDIAVQVADLAAPLFEARQHAFMPEAAAELWCETYLTVTREQLGAMRDELPGDAVLRRLADVAAGAADQLCLALSVRATRRADA